MSKRKYQVTDSRGNIHKRTTQTRKYHFAVVYYIKPYESNWRPGHLYPAAWGAEWCARPDLAENIKRRWQRHEQLDFVEIIPVSEEQQT